MDVAVKRTYKMIPTGSWKVVEHDPNAMCTIEAVLTAGIVSNPKSMAPSTPCEIRLKEQDIDELLRLPQIQERAKKILAEASK